MCGIAAYYDNKNKLGANALQSMAHSLKHRGPDATGFFSHNNFHFAHNRLSIIDLNTESNQPFVSSCGNYVIIFNGEIYNYKELRYEYNLPCRTNSDTEVILELFKLKGSEHVNLLNGMFAYSIFDIRSEKLFLCRDRIGVKPLFYYWENDFLAFASELKALKCLPNVKNNLSLNHQAVGEYLHLGYIPQPNCIYNEIKKFPAGHYAIFDKNNLELKPYWSLKNNIHNNIISQESDAEKELENLLHSSIKYRLISDVPVGVFLSGGVDSSLVSALASQHHSGKIQSFTIGFNEGKFDESGFAKKVAQHLGTQHEELMISEKEVFNSIDHIFDIYDEPYADQSMLPSLAVCKLASEHVKVVLTGDGGDEFFYGYGAYSWAQRLQNPLIQKSRKLIATILNTQSAKYKRVSELLNYPSNDFQSHIHSKENGYFSVTEIQKLTKRNFNYNSPFNHNTFQRKLSYLEQQALFDAEVYLKDDLLVKMDRASMHYSIEAREPLLDFRIAEFALNLDENLKKNGKTDKYLLKKILYKYVPKSLIDRPKWGFTIPLNTWLNNDLKYLQHDFLNKSIIDEYGILDFSEVKKIQSTYHQKPYQIQQLWALILLHKWLKEKW